MYSLSIDHHEGDLYSRDIELEGSHVGFILMHLAAIGTLIGTGLLHIAKDLQYRHCLSRILYWHSSGLNILRLVLRSMEPEYVPVAVRGEVLPRLQPFNGFFKNCL
jgi:hypothetical protein